jgi:CheY-like chemotaxis protein
MPPKFMKNIKPRLLVIDDDYSVLESLKKLLESEHYDVHPARDGVEALESFKSNTPDLVVLDLNLGTEDGWNVFNRMTQTNPFVPTVVITAEFDQRERAVAAGVEALIEKPIDVPVFLEIISQLLAETHQQRLNRVCGDDEYCRYVARPYELFVRRLNERHSTPLKLSSALDAVLPSRRRMMKQLKPAQLETARSTQFG